MTLAALVEWTLLASRVKKELMNMKMTTSQSGLHHDLPVDLHTHTVASGHGTTDTISDMAKEAAARGMQLLGISDHGPRTFGAATESYFRSLKSAPRVRFGVQIRYGAEVNILEGGTLDLPDSVLADLDYVIASMHTPPRRCPHGAATSGSVEENTRDYLLAMRSPYVHILGHCDRPRFPADYERIIRAAWENNVIIEINNASLSPEGDRELAGSCARDNCKALLALCLQYRVPILISSDSHGREHIGDAPEAMELIRSMCFPKELIRNYTGRF